MSANQDSQPQETAHAYHSDIIEQSAYGLGYALSGTLATAGAAMEFLPDGPLLIRILGGIALAGSAAAGYISAKANIHALRNAYSEGVSDGEKAENTRFSRIFNSLSNRHMALLESQQALEEDLQAFTQPPQSTDIPKDI